MDKVKKERKPRQPKAEKPQSKPRNRKDQVLTELIGKHNLKNEDWYKKSFIQDYKIVENEMIKQMNKVKENSKLSADQKQKKLNKVIEDNTKVLINLANDYKNNTEFFKTMFHRKK